MTQTDSHSSNRAASAPRGTGRTLRSLALSIPGPLLGLILVCILFSFLSPYFLTTRNIVNIFSQVSQIGIMAAGAALVILIGGIDLSEPHVDQPHKLQAAERRGDGVFGLSQSKPHLY